MFPCHSPNATYSIRDWPFSVNREFNFAFNTRDHKVVVTHNPMEPSVSDDLFRIQKAGEEVREDEEKER